LYRGVVPISFDHDTNDHMILNLDIVDELKRRGTVRDGDLVIITKGDLTRVMGGTNALKIIKVGDLAQPESEK